MILFIAGFITFPILLTITLWVLCKFEDDCLNGYGYEKFLVD